MDFFFFLITYNFALDLWVFVVLIALLWVDIFWYFGVVFINSQSHVLSPSLMALLK